MEIEELTKSEAYNEIDKAIEKAIIDLLRQSDAPQQVKNIVVSIEEDQEIASPIAVREAIWRLIDRREIELTRDLQLKAAITEVGS